MAGRPLAQGPADVKQFLIARGPELLLLLYDAACTGDIMPINTNAIPCMPRSNPRCHLRPDRLHWKQVASQHSPSAPVPPWRELHLYRFRRTA